MESRLRLDKSNCGNNVITRILAGQTRARQELPRIRMQLSGFGCEWTSFQLPTLQFQFELPGCGFEPVSRWQKLPCFAPEISFIQLSTLFCRLERPFFQMELPSFRPEWPRCGKEMSGFQQEGQIVGRNYHVSGQNGDDTGWKNFPSRRNDRASSGAEPK